MNISAVVSTSGNPFHFGHLQVFRAAVGAFGEDKVALLIAQNDDKAENNIEELLYHIVPYNIKNIIVLPKKTLLSKYMLENGIKYNVRGIRNAVDMEYEHSLDVFNKTINPNMETIMFFTDSSFNHLSSTSIRTFLKYQEVEKAKIFMNEDSLYRFIHKRPKFTVFFGKSCIGKSTALKRLNSSILDIDKFIWIVFEEFYGKDFSIIEKEKVFNKIFVEKKFKEFEENCRKFLNKDFWSLFFQRMEEAKNQAPTFLVDFAAIGFYWDMIPVEYRTMLRLIKMKNSEEKRRIFAEKRGFLEKIDVLDKFYKDCPYYDQEIDLEKNN